jgi:deazaflavin-dependent oxidoreductase (nitroreductase family)
MLPSFLRYFFWLFNKIFMVPVFRLGLGSFWGNPFWGYMMVLKTIGRKSGKIRYTPVNYAIMNGNIYCLAGWGQIADWYRNIIAVPQIEVLLPGRALAGVAEEVNDSSERIITLRKVLIAGGLAGFMFGVNPHTVSDEELAEITRGLPLFRITPVGVGSDAGDPGGWLWVLSLCIFLKLVWIR